MAAVLSVRAASSHAAISCTAFSDSSPASRRRHSAQPAHPGRRAPRGVALQARGYVAVPRALRGSSCRARRASSPLVSASSVVDTVKERVSEPARLALFVGWAGFLGYAFGVAPNSPEASAADIELVKGLVSTPFSGSVNPLFEAQFNSLGVMPAVFAALLFPGAKDQKPVPALPFVALSFALGYFALGPYLIAREARPEPVKKSSLGLVTRNVFEAKWNALFLVAFASYLLFYAASNFDSSSAAEYLTLWGTQPLVNVSSVDLCILSVAIYNPLLEDMQRRGWGDDKLRALAFCILPVLGPAAYILLRPSLEE